MKKHGSCKGVFTALVIASACIYVFALYYLLFGGIGRGNIMLSREMVKSYAYNLIPLKTVIGYITAIMEGTARGSAIRNLVGNLVLLMPLGFYLPFFAQKAAKLGIYAIVVAVGIVIIEVMQLVTMTGSLDVDDFILNYAGALIGFLICRYTHIRVLFKLCAWRQDGAAQ
jgi:glycopeptide antibiotics resistance protein